MAALAQVPALTIDLAGVRFPAVIRTGVPLTDEELMAFSRRNRPFRVERNACGELEIMSPVGGEGGHWEALVIAALARWAEEHGGIVFSSNAGFRLGDGSVLSPDAAWVAEERWEGLTREEQRGFAPLCPDFLIEVLSASDSRGDLERKMESWLANGARLAWMVDPYRRTVEVYRAEGVEVLEEPEVVEAVAVVPGFRLAMARIWDR